MKKDKMLNTSDFHNSDNDDEKVTAGEVRKRTETRRQGEAGQKGSSWFMRKKY